MMFDEREQAYILDRLKRVSKHLQNHCMAAEGWYRPPNFHFKFAEGLEYKNHMDDWLEKF